MSDNFKALLINQEGENFTREIKKIDKRLDLEVGNYLPGQSIRVSVIVQPFSPVIVRTSW